jgi:hypothetical protein
LGSRTRQAGGDGPPSTSKGKKKKRWRPGSYAEKKVSRDHPGNTIVGIFLGGFTWFLQWTSERKTMVLSYSQIFSVLIGSNPG